MNIYLFWILFLALWATVPLMIIKGRVDESPKIQTSPKVKPKKKVGLIKGISDLVKIICKIIVDNLKSMLILFIKRKN